MLKFLDKVVEIVTVFCFFISTSFLIINVLNRYLILGLLRDWAKDYDNFRPIYFSIRDFLGNIVVTADEVPGLLLVWISFLGAYLVIRQGGHISFDMIFEAMTKRMKTLVSIFNTITMCGFFVLLLWQSSRMISISGGTEIETVEIAQGWFMLILPISSVLIIVAILTSFFKK